MSFEPPLSLFVSSVARIRLPRDAPERDRARRGTRDARRERARLATRAARSASAPNGGASRPRGAEGAVARRIGRPRRLPAGSQICASRTVEAR
eukprot:31318-Pelagococcus_subviridis.AAC.13